MSQTVSFPTPSPLDLRVRNPAGVIAVTAADTDTSTVEVEALDSSAEAQEFVRRTGATLSGHGDELVVEVPERRGLRAIRQVRIAVRVTVPTGSRVTTQAASADVTCTGRYAAATVHSASGNVAVDEVDGEVEAHLASGRVRLGSGGRVTARTASGNVEVGHATGDVSVHAASGDVRIGVAEASVEVKTASGGVTIAEARRGSIVLDAASGDLRVGVRSGVVARLDLQSITGKVRSELPIEDTAPQDGAALEIRARTVSGNLLVTAAARADGAAAPLS